MTALPVDVIKFIQGAVKDGEITLSDGRWFHSDGTNSKEITSNDLARWYHETLAPCDRDIEDLFTLLTDMMAIWGKSVEWIKERSRSNKRPVCRRIFWLIAKKKYPKVSMKYLGLMVNVNDHTTIVKGVRNLRGWIWSKDPDVMELYRPVAHLLNSEILINE